MSIRLRSALFGVTVSVMLLNPQTRCVAIETGPSVELPLTSESKKKIATEILEDLRLIDAATDQWAIEGNKSSGAKPTLAELASYLKVGSRLHTKLAAGHCVDSLGNPIALHGVDATPTISRKTFERLKGVAGKEFWGPFAPKE